MVISTNENHHPDKKNRPDYTIPITRKEHQKIHHIEPIETPLANKMRQYDKVTQIIVIMKNWQTSQYKDFGNKPDMNLEQMIKLKKQLIKEITTLLGDDLKKVKHIKGFGPRYLAGILAYAHPSRFSSQRKFLFYCGYTQASRELKHYNRKIKPIIYQVIKNTIMKKDDMYYNMYISFKEHYKQKFPERHKMKWHMLAINRTATFLLKEVYFIWGHDKLRSACSFNNTVQLFNSTHEIPKQMEANP